MFLGAPSAVHDPPRNFMLLLLFFFCFVPKPETKSPERKRTRIRLVAWNGNGNGNACLDPRSEEKTKAIRDVGYF